MTHNLFASRRTFEPQPGRSSAYYSLAALEEAGLGKVSRLPVALRVVLESVLRNCDGKRITEEHVRELAAWQPTGSRTREIPFAVARVLCPDSSGLPLLGDVAAMRGAAQRVGRDPTRVEPAIPVDLVVDHSVQVDHFGTADALTKNMLIEFERNAERYEFIKWADQAFSSLRIVPPGVGILHQVNLEFLAAGIWERDGVTFPDTLLGADSHTPMINGIGVVGWGGGGIEAIAAMLGQPVYLLTPDVVGVELKGRLSPGVTATDMVLSIVEALRRVKVVGKFVEFFGEGASSLTVPDRATIANMSPEYGATIGYFGVDEQTTTYYRQTGRSESEVAALEAYFRAQGMFGIPRAGECDYSEVVTIDLSAIGPSIAGPRRPQDRIALADTKNRFEHLLHASLADGGYGKPAGDLDLRVPVATLDAPVSDGGIALAIRARETGANAFEMGHGDVLLAAITSCTNTSNPGVIIAAGLLAKKAVERGLKVNPWIKTSFGPGSRVVPAYLKKAGLDTYLDALGFQVVGFGCTTCIGNSGPLDPAIEKTIVENDLVAAAVLSGNRNFEARIHQNLKANFIMSPPLVVAFALAGRVNIDMASEPLGTGSDGEPVYLADIWPSPDEVAAGVALAVDPAAFHALYGDLSKGQDLWNNIEGTKGPIFFWDKTSNYMLEAPFFEDFSMEVPVPAAIMGARPLAIFGDSVTTDHISPGGSIRRGTAAADYLESLGVQPSDFNTYIARRTNHEVMMRGTFANVRIRNLMVPGSEGGVTIYQPSGERMGIYDTAMRYIAAGVPSVVIAGEDYGTGSSRDWAAKGPILLGVKAVIARSFERIHRGNLVGMGVLPLQFEAGVSAQSLELDGTEIFDVPGADGALTPRQVLPLRIHRRDGSVDEVRVTVRIDTPIEIDIYRHRGILPYALRNIL